MDKFNINHINSNNNNQSLYSSEAISNNNKHIKPSNIQPIFSSNYQPYITTNSLHYSSSSNKYLTPSIAQQNDVKELPLYYNEDNMKNTQENKNIDFLEYREKFQKSSSNGPEKRIGN